MTRIAVAVVSYNTRDLLARCLRSLGDDPRLTVWVVDNASSDGSAQLVRERFPGVHLDARKENLGFGRAVNLVARQVPDWDWLAVANADTALEPGAIDALLAAGAEDSGAGVLAPRLVLPDGTTQHSMFTFWSPAFALGYQTRRHRRSRAWGEAHCVYGCWDPERARRAPWALGAFLLVRRAAWEAAGGFDPDQWLYAEDLDLGWRAAEAGWATRYVPDAHVRHEESAAAATAWGGSRTERWMAASYDWMFRRRGAARTRAVAAINVLGEGMRWAVSGGDARAGYRRWAALHSYGLRGRGFVRSRLAAPPEDGG